MFGAVARSSMRKYLSNGFRLLRVLDLETAPIKTFPKEIMDLFYLSYLSLRKTRVKVIPRSIGNLQNLETLDLKKTHVSELPVEILKLQKLRHLLVYNLKIESYAHFNSKFGFKAFSGENEIIDLQHLSSPPQFLERLYLTGRLEELPSWIPSLHSLVKLSLKWSQLKDDPVVHLQDLPNLVHLELLHTCDNDMLSFKSGGFKKLKVLGLDKFDKLRCVKVEKGAMPCLERLTIQRCKLLKRVPSGVKNLTKLKSLQFFDMPYELILKLQPDGEGPSPAGIVRRSHELRPLWKV
ncbi:hypothetical protein M0R45_025264 [Rubus argutus]|uniref:Disease resistance R13L4/SHOC-2-like LRR domain-containing protein n=1 Tax=Rubus argutus TaxID=59490 RepID=A0AAW1WXQ6_RUBAR